MNGQLGYERNKEAWPWSVGPVSGATKDRTRVIRAVDEELTTGEFSNE